MDLKPLSVLISAMVCFSLGTYVLSKNPKKIINISFLALAYSCGLWALTLFVIMIGTRHETLKLAGHMAFVTGSLIVCNLLLFAYVFPDKSDEWPSLRALLLIYVPGLLVVALGFTPLVMKDITYVGSSVRPVYGSGILVQMLYDVGYAVTALFLLARKYFKNSGRFERVQLKYMFWGISFSFIGIVVFALLLPIAGVPQYSSPFIAVAIMFATGAISYAIVRHRLMDLGVVFRSVLIYVGMVVVLGAGLVILLFLVDPILHLGFTGSAFFAAVCAALVVHPVRRNVELVVDKYFFRGRYNYQAALSEFSASMTKILDLTDLQDRIVHEVAAILQVKTAALFLWEPTEQRYVVRALLPLSLGESHPGFAAASQAAQRMNRERTLLVREELRRALPQAEFAPLEREFDRVGAEVFIPLIYRGELIGLLTLGEKTSTDIFSSEDLNLLGTLGNQAAVALENAQLHHTVTMLKNHNENILKYMSSGVIAIDRDQIVTTCNDKARDILNLPAYVLPNRTIDILPPQLRSMLAETLEEKAIYPNHELQILSEAGSIKHLSASTSLLRDEKSEVTGALLVFTDLTDLKLLESEMWRADKLASLGTLAAGMAHEIKNPLVSIKTFAQLLPTRFEDKDFRDTFAAITVDEVERINSIVEKLLEFARPTAPVFEQVDVIETIEEVLLLISAEASKHDVALTRNFEADSAPIIGDKAQLKQALLNLCLNGLQAVSELEHRSSGELTIAVGFRKRRNRAMGDFSLDEIAQLYYGTEVATSTDDAEMLVIKVSDNGRGISREDLPRIFDPFFTTKKKGMGLGLAVVHGIIKEHSGNITVDSAEGGGTEFVVALPVTQLFAKERV